MTCCMNNACSVLQEYVALCMQALLKSWSCYMAIYIYMHIYELSQMLHVRAQVYQTPSTVWFQYEKQRDMVCGCPIGARTAFLWASSTRGVHAETRFVCSIVLAMSEVHVVCFGFFVSTFQLWQYKIAGLAVTFRSLCAMDIIYLLLVFVTSPTAKGIDV